MDSVYAIIISRGENKDKNRIRYWNDGGYI